MRFDARIEVGRSPAEVFAYLDDFANTPKWNPRCVEVAQTSPGPHAQGATLRYRYQEPGRKGEMTGAITTYQPGLALKLSFTDAMLDVAVAFVLAPQGTGTMINHTIEIAPKSFVAKLMSPIIKRATKAQVQAEVDALKALLG